MQNIFPRLSNTYSRKLIVRIGVSGLLIVCGNLQVRCSSSSSMASEAKHFVDSIVASKKIVIFSKTTCGYCSKAKQVLKLYIPTIINASHYQEIEIDDRSDCEDIQSYFAQLTGARSVSFYYLRNFCPLVAIAIFYLECCKPWPTDVHTCQIDFGTSKYCQI